MSRSTKGWGHRAGSQGTWPFMAAELFLSPEIAHSFLHDLESTYFVLLFHGITNMKHTLPKGLAANIFHDILNSRRYGQGGGIQKFFFMLQSSSVGQYSVPSNEPFTRLIHNLHIKLNARYFQLDHAPQEILPQLRLPSFMTPAECMAANFGHDAFIKIFDDVLSSLHFTSKLRRATHFPFKLRCFSSRVWLEKVKIAV